MKAALVLSLFPGIGLLDRAFEEEGFCVVRGPDLLWGGDVKRFHPPAGRFDIVIGGPPCKGESSLAHLNGNPGFSLREEFMRVWAESGAAYYIMEAVKEHKELRIPDNAEPGITNHTSFPRIFKLNNRWLGHEQRRVRYFHSNLDLAPFIEMACFEHIDFKHAVLAGHGGAIGSIERGIAKYSLPDACRLQGLPEDFTENLPFTRRWKYEVVGNGVPLPMGRTIAKAARECIYGANHSQSGNELSGEGPRV